MTTKIQKKTMMCVVMLLSFLMALGVLTFNTYEIAQAQAFEQSIPTFGLYCEDEGIIESGTVKFDLTNSELFSKQKAREESEYRVSGNQAVTFEIPFISSYIDIPQFDVTVNGQAVEGEIWYGDNQKRYGGNNSYLDATSTDNSIIEQKLKMTYSPILDETIIGTLYTVTPNADTMTITLNLEKSCSYVYDGTNRRTESYSPDGTQSWGYENALSRSSYQYFFIGENTVIDFSTTCEFQTQEITFKDFIDRNYNTESIVKTIVEILKPFENCRVYDPCCGSGGMFVQSVKFLQAHSGNRGGISVFGQESNPDTWKMAKMNMAIRGIDANFGPYHQDTFFDDLHPALKADFIMANPPFNLSNWGGEKLKEDKRWKYGVPPTGNANFAWIQHMIHHLAPNGKIGLVLANGALSSQSSGEGEIRKNIINDDLVEGIVALPTQLFYSVTIPVTLWFISKNKKQKGKGKRHNHERKSPSW